MEAPAVWAKGSLKEYEPAFGDLSEPPDKNGQTLKSNNQLRIFF